MEGGEATECFILAKEGGESTHDARHDSGKVAVGQSSSIGRATWRAEENQREGARAAAGLETMRGCYASKQQHRRSCSGGELRWRRQAAAGGSGGGVARPGEASRGELRRWASVGVTRGAALEQERTSASAARRPVTALLRGRGGGAEEQE
jgi:hypothetical protein